jgi:hypothetical protein
LQGPGRDRKKKLKTRRRIDLRCVISAPEHRGHPTRGVARRRCVGFPDRANVGAWTEIDRRGPHDEPLSDFAPHRVFAAGAPAGCPIPGPTEAGRASPDGWGRTRRRLSASGCGASPSLSFLESSCSSVRGTLISPGRNPTEVTPPGGALVAPQTRRATPVSEVRNSRDRDSESNLAESTEIPHETWVP